MKYLKGNQYFLLYRNWGGKIVFTTKNCQAIYGSGFDGKYWPYIEKVASWRKNWGLKVGQKGYYEFTEKLAHIFDFFS